jgi:hypothetical protein
MYNLNILATAAWSSAIVQMAVFKRVFKPTGKIRA